jgi:hypothetical protein
LRIVGGSSGNVKAQAQGLSDKKGEKFMMRLVSLPDFTGAGSALPLVTDSRQGKFVQILADSANTAAIRIGGVEVSATIGFPLIAGASQFATPIAEPMMEFFPLSGIYVYAALGDKYYVIYATN